MFQLNNQLAEQFLIANNYQNFKITKIAGDASFRSYYRINLQNQSLILMYAPPSHEDIEPFIKVARFLRDKNFLAPKIIAIDEQNGFLLLEDFGDISYTKYLQKNPDKELEIYKLACNELIKLHRFKIDSKVIDVPKYNNAVLLREVMLFIDWYLPLNNKSISLKQKHQFNNFWFEQFDQLSQNSNSFVLRDFHADNLMIVNNDNKVKVGLLDFQDALIGSPSYDLVSLLEDARRDVSLKTQQDIIKFYLDNTNCDKDLFLREYSILSLQRNIKILGIFARLAIRDGKKQYLQLLPRVLNNVKNRLSSDFDKSNLAKKEHLLSVFL